MRIKAQFFRHILSLEFRTRHIIFFLEISLYLKNRNSKTCDVDTGMALQTMQTYLTLFLHFTF